MKDLYSLNLHETIQLGLEGTVLRVPGGWLYTTFIFAEGEHGPAVSSTFVPFNNEFQLGSEVESELDFKV